LETIPDNALAGNLVEVRFKNTRKGYYINNTSLPLVKGDVVSVEALPGHDVGIVSLTGDLVAVQMKRYNVPAGNLKKIYRKAKPSDVEKWFQAIEKEPEIMCIARQIVSNLKLGMKISDVEFQGDKTKATFYYISDERVDFRQLIKEYADHFKVRIEMKQIGARQEAGKVGGIGTCGRELCCASWMSSFVSVSTGAARYQELSLNPQKLAGQCGKLKCCLNYELKCYMEAHNDFPDTSMPLETEHGKAYHSKTDVFRRVIWYSFEKDNENAVFIPLDVDVVKEIIHLNRQGIKVKALEASSNGQVKEPAISYQNAVGEDSINRFEEKRRKKKKKPNQRDHHKDNKEVQSKKNNENGTRKEVQRQAESAENKPRNERNGRNRNRHRGNREKGNKPEGNKPNPTSRKNDAANSPVA
jgi:cell fate regulator YaaT (PSP1 superfamily)